MWLGPYFSSGLHGGDWADSSAEADNEDEEEQEELRWEQKATTLGE